MNIGARHASQRFGRRTTNESAARYASQRREKWARYRAGNQADFGLNAVVLAKAATGAGAQDSAVLRCKVCRDMHHLNSPLWLKAMALAAEVHRLTAVLPKHEMFGLTSQMRRAAISIASNIAEGAARRTAKEFTAFLHISRGSQAELETQLLLAADFGYVQREMVEKTLDQLHEVGRLTTSTIKRLNHH